MTAAEALADAYLQALANYYLGQIYHVRCDLSRATACFRRSCSILEDYPQGLDPAGSTIGGVPSSLSFWINVWLAWAYADLGAFHEADRCAREAVSFAEGTGQAYALVHAWFARGFTSMLQGKAEEAIPYLERGLRLSLDASIPIGFCLIAGVVGAAYTLSGRTEEGMALLLRVIEASASYGVGHYQSRRLVWLGEAYLLAGRAKEAVSVAEQSLEVSRQHKERGNEAWAYHLLGEIALHEARDMDSSKAHFSQSMILAAALGMRPLVAHCHADLGKLYGRTGKRAQAQEHLTTATTMYREMGMQFWLEKAEAEMKELT